MSKKELEKPIVSKVQQLLIANAGTGNPSEDVGGSVEEMDEVTIGLKDVTNDPRKLQRMKTILRAIKTKKILPASALYTIVLEDEENRNHKDKMDRRSLLRILEHLISEKLISLVVKTMENGPVLKFYAEPTFNPDEWVYEDQPADLVDDPDGILSSIVTETDLEMMVWLKIPDGPKNNGEVLNSKKMYAPKFLRLSVLHDLVFYLVRGYTGEIDHQGLLLSKLEESYPMTDELKTELPPLYSDHISCYMFIPPLSPIHERVPGWCSVGEIILNTPLSLYIKLVKLKSACAELQEYLDDPIRCNYILRSLPPVLRRGLITHRQLSHIVQDLRRLCYMGLVKFGHRPNKRNLYLESFFVNLRACIIDTTKSRSGYFQIDPEETYDVIPWLFQSKADVKAYWVKLFNVCLETKLGHKNDASLDQEKFTMREERKDILVQTLTPVTVADAYGLDNGEMPGDRLGAGGIDSCLFSFLRNNWVGSPLMGKSTVRANQRFEPVNVPVLKPKASKPKKTKVSQPPKPRKPTLDELDLKATEQMRTLRVQWSKDEDNVVLLIKAAMNFICPNSRQSARISWTDLRAALWRHVPSSTDKTQLAVRRRIQFLVKRLCRAQLVAGLTQVLRNTPDVVRQFDCSEIVAQIKPSAPNIKHLRAILRSTFHQLVDFMVERFIDNGHIVNLQELQLPDTMEELAEIYDVNARTGPTLTLRKVKKDSIRAILLSSMTSCNDKAAMASQLYEVYRQYDESILQSAVRKLHRQKVITLKRRIIPSMGPTVKYLPVRNSPYQFSFGFCFLMNTKYRQSMYHDAYLELNRLLCTTPGQSIELNLTSCGPAAFVLSSLGHVELTAATPEQFVVIDSQLIPENVSKKIMERYNELMKQCDPEARTPVKRLAEVADEEPGAKKQVLCTDRGESDAVEERVTKALKRRCDEPEIADHSLGFRSARLALYTLREVANREMESQVSKNPVDLFVVSSSKVLCTVNGSLNQFGFSDGKNVKKILSKMTARSDIFRQTIDETAVIKKINSLMPAIQLEDLIATMSFITSRGSFGVSHSDLLHYCDRDELLDAVRLLENHHLILRVGVDETRFVSHIYASTWAIQSLKITRINREKIKPSIVAQPGPSTSTALTEHSTPIQIIMRPWLRIEGTVNRRVFDKFLGSILGHIMLNPGISVTALTRQFHSGLSPVWTKELIDVLVEIGCVSRVIIYRLKPSLFSAGHTRISDAYACYKPDDQVLLEPKIDAIIKLGQFIGNKTYNKDILEVPVPKKPRTK